ncbi:MAG: Aromatic amino acid aminotransferase [Candidatus Falkowbacteria bacterium GW2011_GWC2_38_22]|uniref:Aminotransferase n=1 Tax=Candidatus Falkowbacteria bacterium GW2011_GWE1_38_31 TaxID=1618638 RepID=A0A0G0MB52_9BACT|nr:MAG: Aromatic amino acid aminotransferase [Candidatus Falkowbacteria bacterium GW2011_GWF2_38_1205]KKQ62129.1 MAG: Aromatic amino acid aminotransferase [Candidatus Falkowbacteria bacterium GW2011_GWC2_38_22]KKQ64279.1 MAG: Aromatic amino acid aminotransferase [Candidatus Falkowbacteria bacterium GW2011_GWF1_38_22]KKQ66256.1 MAG: Aromatic amino acid aminotransferase [Candidatus Falkowbacteria bacterium GW2011_GWE2_38_254]KKQ70984.1 MAG: Aromatic amino acid aminotransferase [Candidatus Falkowb
MSQRTKNLRLSIIKQIELRAAKYPDSISLAQGIPSFDTPESIKRRVELALKRGVVAKYSLSPGLPELRELIELQLQKDNMFYDWEKEIIVTAGSIEGITATILAITDPGDEIIIPEPTYTSYHEVIILSGCKPVFVPLNEDKGWALELDKYEKAITDKTRAIFYCNPNNPTGTIYNKEQLLSLAELAKKHDLYIITDEVYKDFLYNNEKIFSLAEIPELRKRIIRIYGFSKAYAMTGWRVGYVHSDESVIKEIIKVHDSLVTCAPVISQYAAMGALEMGESDVSAFNIEYAKRRDLICKRLDRLSRFFSYIRPESAYYVFPKILRDFTEQKNSAIPDSWEYALALLEKTHVAVVPGSAFGPNGEGHIRLSFGRKPEDINEAFDRFENNLI